jgi:membrane associated rhomboid family serine protease
MDRYVTHDRHLTKHLKILLSFIGLLWALELIDTLFLNQSLNMLGIRPRTAIGLRGILLAPLLHGNLAHLAANTIPLFVLGLLVMLRSLQVFRQVTVSAWLVGGSGTWLTGGFNTLHVGASILIFGYLGYLMAAAYYERSVAALLTALIVGLLYGSMIFGILPLRAGISWQGHLFGLLGGVLVARSRRIPPTPS